MLLMLPPACPLRRTCIYTNPGTETHSLLPPLLCAWTLLTCHHPPALAAVPHPPVNIAEVRAVVRPLPAQPTYVSTARNSIRSRAWVASINGCSFKVEKAWVVTRTGNSYDLPPNLEGVPAAAATFAPSHLERMLTRSAAGPGSRARHAQEVTAVFNLVNEPWVKYTPASVSDRGLKPHEWTSARLHTDVLFLESHTERFELARIPPAHDRQEEGGVPAAERYRFSKCTTLLTARRAREVGIPLPAPMVQVVQSDLEWEELQWGPSAVVMRGATYPITRLHFMPIVLEEAGEGGEGQGEMANGPGLAE